MGSFYDSIHVRTKSYDLVENALIELAKGDGYKFYLAPVINGWVSLFPCKYGDEMLAREISKQTQMNVLHLMIYDDDIFYYLYYHGGELIDEYDSRPDYFGEKVTTKERKRLKGKPEVFRELVDSEGKIGRIRKILNPQPLLKKMQIPDELKDVDRKIKSLSKELDHFVNTPNAINEYLAKNPDVLKDDYSSLVKQLKSEGITSEEDIQKFLEKSGKAQEMGVKIIETFWKSQLSSKEFELFNPNSDEAKKLSAALEQMSRQFAVNDKDNAGIAKALFDSEPMGQFAEILGISNSLTSYKYLKAGETDNIKEWDKFIEIP